jgi:hypothetical protein
VLPHSVEPRTVEQRGIPGSFLVVALRVPALARIAPRRSTARRVHLGLLLSGGDYRNCIPPAWAAGVYERLFRRSRIVGSCLCISMRSLRVSIPKFVNASTPSSLSP